MHTIWDASLSLSPNGRKRERYRRVPLLFPTVIMVNPRQRTKERQCTMHVTEAELITHIVTIELASLALATC